MKPAAKRIPSPAESPSRRWGLESWLDCLAWVLLVLGIFVTLLGATVFIGSAFAQFRPEGKFIAFLAAMLYGILGVVVSLGVFLLFRWCGETLRLLKKLSCLEFSGQISASRREPTSLWICSACQNSTYNEHSCEHCGATFE